MIDTRTYVVDNLKQTGLNVYNEDFVNSSTEIPCLTYLEYDNNELKQGDTLGYSNLVYHIKVWGKDLQTISKYQAIVDDIMRVSGFKRVGSNFLKLDDICQQQLKYAAIALENFE